MANVILLAGLGFGDEGKGTMVDYLAATAAHSPHTVVRYNGGAQAAHNVVLNNGFHHTFAQFGSGTFANVGVRTHLSRYMLVNPITLDTEAQALAAVGEDPYELLTVEREALVTTVYHVAANRIREILRGKDRHGSCGLGIGETVADSLAQPELALRIGDLADRETLRRKLHAMREYKLMEFLARRDEIPIEEMFVFAPERLDHYVEWYSTLGAKMQIVDRDYLPSILGLKEKTVLFEGAQGVLLDETYGFHPHTTWSNTTFANAMDLLQGFTGDVLKVGVLRGHMTRHGAGPFPTELCEVIPLTSDIQTDMHNKWGQFQEHLRVGHFDAVLARYALEVIGGVDALAITNLDKLGPRPQLCPHYWYDSIAGDPVRRLPVRKNPTLEQQEQLGRDLTTLLAPHYETLDSREDIVDRIADELRTEVRWISVGPKREHKWPAQYLRRLGADQWNS